MLLGIISDTHDRLNRTLRAVDLLKAEGAEALVHCGDYTTPDIIYACGELPGSYALGNNDADDVLALRRAVRDVNGTFLEWGGVITLADRRIGVVHGHLTRDVQRLLAEKPAYLLFGHSHIPTDHANAGVRCINPGALHRAAEHTVALLNLETDELRFLTVN